MSDFKPGDYVRCINPLAGDWFPLMEGAVYLVCPTSINSDASPKDFWHVPLGSIRLRAYAAPCSASCFEKFSHRAGDWFWLPSSGDRFWLKDPDGMYCVYEDSENEFHTDIGSAYPIFGRSPHVEGESKESRKSRLSTFEQDLIKKYDLKNVNGGW